MKLHRPILALVGVSMLALAAGAVAGRLAARLPAEGTPTADDVSLSSQLQLTDGQRQQMRTIWEQVETVAHDCQRQAQSLQRQRDDAVFSLLTPEQKNKYLQLSTECFGRIAALNEKREAAFKDAVARTDKILAPAQRARYEQLIKDRVGPRGLPPAAEADPQQPQVQVARMSSPG